MFRRRSTSRRAAAQVCDTLKRMRKHETVTPEMMTLFLEGRGRCPGGKCGGAHTIKAKDDGRFDLNLTDGRCGCTSRRRSSSKHRSKSKRQRKCRPKSGLIKKLMKMLFKKKRCLKKKKSSRRKCRPKRKRRPRC